MNNKTLTNSSQFWRKRISWQNTKTTYLPHHTTPHHVRLDSIQVFALQKIWNNLGHRPVCMLAFYSSLNKEKRSKDFKFRQVLHIWQGCMYDHPTTKETEDPTSLTMFDWYWPCQQFDFYEKAGCRIWYFSIHQNISPSLYELSM